MIGSQIIMDLPAGGEDYEENDNITGCGIPAEGREMSLNKSARVQQWPWLAALYHYKEFSEGSEQQFCGGALITDTHILTAAHCLQKYLILIHLINQNLVPIYYVNVPRWF